MFANLGIEIELPYHTGPCSVQVGNVSAGVFNTGQDQHSLPVIMKRLQNITIKRSRGTFNKMSIINKMRANVNATDKRSKVDHLKTDVIMSGSTTPDILPGSDGKTCLKFMLACIWPCGQRLSNDAECAGYNHCHGDAVLHKEERDFASLRFCPRAKPTSRKIGGLCIGTMHLHEAAS